MSGKTARRHEGRCDNWPIGERLRRDRKRQTPEGGRRSTTRLSLKSLCAGAVRCCQCCQCLSDIARSSRAVGCCRSCRVWLSDAVGAIRSVRLLLLSGVGPVLSGAVGCCRWCCRGELVGL